jgi:hypothetical protein
VTILLQIFFKLNGILKIDTKNRVVIYFYYRTGITPSKIFINYHFFKYRFFIETSDRANLIKRIITIAVKYPRNIAYVISVINAILYIPVKAGFSCKLYSIIIDERDSIFRHIRKTYNIFYNQLGLTVDFIKESVPV